MIKKLFNKFIIKLGSLLVKMDHRISRHTLPVFANKPTNLKIEFPRQIINPERIHFGKNVSIGPNSFIMAFTHYPTRSMISKNYQSKIRFAKFYGIAKTVVGRRWFYNNSI